MKRMTIFRSKSKDIFLYLVIFTLSSLMILLLHEPLQLLESTSTTMIKVMMEPLETNIKLGKVSFNLPVSQERGGGVEGIIK